MKRTHSLSASCAIAIAFSSAGALASSCIFEDPSYDEFCKTLWKSNEVPLGPFDVSSLALEFYCNHNVSVNTTALAGRSSDSNAGSTVYGTYEYDGAIAVLSGLSIDIEDHTITFIEAHLSQDVLFLLWRVDDVYYPFTTPLYTATVPESSQ